jgi:hypothetical protein
MSALARSNDTPITSEADLRAWFDLEVHPFLARHAASLARLGKYGLYPLAAILLTFPGAVLLLAFGAFWPSLVCVAILIPSVAVVTVRGPIYMAGGAGFRALFKHRVVASIVARVLPGASYDPDLALAGSVLDASGLFHDEIAYRGDDLVRGTTGRTPFAMGDVHAGITRRGDLRSGFEGLLFHAEFNRSLVGRTVVLPAGQTPQALVLNRGLAPVGLESPEFAALFSVYASDPIEARYVLTPNTMERLVDLARTVGRPPVRGLRSPPRLRRDGQRKGRVRGTCIRRRKGLGRGPRLRGSLRERPRDRGGAGAQHAHLDEGFRAGGGDRGRIRFAAQRVEPGRRSRGLGLPDAAQPPVQRG